MSDTHHFKETVNAGVLGVNLSTPASLIGTGVYTLQLTDLPIFQRFQSCFEFARLNKCTIEFIPKYNMQLNQQPLAGVSATAVSSVSGTFITAIDQIPIDITIGTSSPAINWLNDVSNSTGTTSATPYSSTVITPGYIRGLQGSKEKELYKAHRVTFTPAFYTPVLAGVAGGTFSTGAYTRQLKKWVTTQLLLAGSTDIPVGPTGNGPIYYGPVYAFDVNNAPSTDNISISMFDVRMKYSMSFKRLRGV